MGLFMAAAWGTVAPSELSGLEDSELSEDIVLKITALF
jgi:hypothetical protein